MVASITASYTFISPFLPTPVHSHCNTYSLQKKTSYACTKSPSSIHRTRDNLIKVLSTRTTTDRVTSPEEVIPLIEALESNTQPVSADSSQLLGCWLDRFATRPSSASPIQRLAVSAGRFAPRVEQVVLATEENKHTAALIVNRLDLRRLIGAVLNVVAKVERVEGARLYIRFTEAWFGFNWELLGRNVNFRFPYPVPFELLGDKACGWVDVTYLDQGVRVVRGNKGTCFVLLKVEDGDEIPIGEDVRKLV